jgi:hypothetical protein
MINTAALLHDLLDKFAHNMSSTAADDDDDDNRHV